MNYHISGVRLSSGLGAAHPDTGPSSLPSPIPLELLHHPSVTAAVYFMLRLSQHTNKESNNPVKSSEEQRPLCRSDYKLFRYTNKLFKKKVSLLLLFFKKTRKALCCVVLCYAGLNCIQCTVLYHSCIYHILLGLLTQDLYLKLQAKPCLKTKPEIEIFMAPCL